MLSLPDFEKKRIVFISSKEDFPNDLKFCNSNIVLFRDDKKVNQISCHLVFSVFILGHFTITSQLIKQAQEYGISFFFLDYSLRSYGQIMSKAEGNYKLRERQYRMNEDDSTLIAKQIVKNKIFNQNKLLKDLKKEGGKLEEVFRKIEGADNIDSLRGYEGDFARMYFKEIFGEVGWYRRAPQAREDIVNFLLDIGYTFLFNFVDSLLLLFGFDTYKGFFHQLFFQRKSLSCDVIEVMRPIIDKVLIKAYHLKQVNEDDFRYINGSFDFRNKKGLREKYVDIWFKVIMENRELIYQYVLEFYRYIMDSNKYEFPEFEI